MTQHVTEDYLLAIGKAAYAFARLEWQAVWCCELLSPGYVYEVGKNTAGVIAKNLLQIASSLPDKVEFKASFVEAAEQFKAEVEIRNAIMHGKPGTDMADRTECLFRNGSPIILEFIRQSVRKFSRCEAALNSLFYGKLLPHAQSQPGFVKPFREFKEVFGDE